jgi:hypothetical protein
MPKSWKRWSLLCALAALLTGCYASAGVPYYGADYYGTPSYRTYGYYSAPSVVVRSRPAWGYYGPRHGGYARERVVAGRGYHGHESFGGYHHHHR